MTLGYFTTIKGAGTVVLADLLFVYHAMLMMILYGIQFVIYKVVICVIIFRKEKIDCRLRWF